MLKIPGKFSAGVAALWLIDAGEILAIFLPLPKKYLYRLGTHRKMFLVRYKHQEKFEDS